MLKILETFFKIILNTFLINILKIFLNFLQCFLRKKLWKVNIF